MNPGLTLENILSTRLVHGSDQATLAEVLEEIDDPAFRDQIIGAVVKALLEQRSHRENDDDDDD